MERNGATVEIGFPLKSEVAIIFILFLSLLLLVSPKIVFTAGNKQ